MKPHRSRRNYSLEIDSNGELLVRTPLRASKKAINEFVKNNQVWIDQQKSKIMAKRSELSEWLSDSLIFFHGKKFEIVFGENPVVIFNESTITLPAGMNKKDFLLDSAKKYLPERCLDIAEMMNLNVSEIRIKKMKSCWGTCSKYQVITLNQALIQVPTWVSDYVIVHECAHLKHFDHSAQFWDLVSEYFNDFKLAKKWLKDHQIALI